MSRWFIRLNWIALVLIYLVIIAGSFVRISGSGMGCPDWPKCFGKWIPPTTETELPANYREVYGEKRVKKVEKFCSILRFFGMSETAKKIKNNPQTYEELPFNAGKTWIEYVNRLVGFLAGNAVLAIFIWVFFRYRKDKYLLFLCFVNLIILSFQAWFGSIVVATNLVPWTITVHMFLALVIVGLQLVILQRVSPILIKQSNLPKPYYYLLLIVFLICAIQMFLGTQVRESVDFLTKEGYTRQEWNEKMGMVFFIHRSFSWLVLGLLTWLFAWNWLNGRNKWITVTYIFLSLELIGGVLLHYAEMPGLVQVSHLLFASLIFGTLWILVFQKEKTKSFDFFKKTLNTSLLD